MTLCHHILDVQQTLSLRFLIIYRKNPQISPSMYKPLQIQAPQTRNAKTPPLNRPSKYKPPGGLVLGNCPEMQSKTKKNGKFPT